MVRARQRLHETTIRAALGASTARLIQQILTETLVTVFLGGALALLLGWAALQAIVAVEPSSFANLGHVSLDLRVLAFTFAIALLTSVIVALAPISTVGHLKLAEDLKGGGRSTTRRQSKSSRSWSPPRLRWPLCSSSEQAFCFAPSRTFSA
jgi:putative ABC transport system permease protein